MLPIRQSLLVLCLGAVAACTAATNSDPATGAQEADWDAESVRQEASSTHLWIVDRAIDILAKHPENANATSAHALLTRATCQPKWQQGLFDADFLHQYNGARSDLKASSSDIDIGLSGATWKSHFYDPDTHLNWKGESNPTAYTEALAHLKNARTMLPRDEGGACYELGLSLHFLTDLTQPMHAANYTSLSRPKRLHSNVEEWAMDNQADYALDDWSGPSTLAVEPYIVSVARASKASWAMMFGAIADAYEAHPNRVVCGSLRTSAWNVLVAQEIDHPMCWNTSATVKAQVGDALRSAQETTARYLAIIGGLQ